MTAQPPQPTVIVTLQLDITIAPPTPPTQRFLIAAHCTQCGHRSRFTDNPGYPLEGTQCNGRIWYAPFNTTLRCGASPPWPWVCPARSFRFEGWTFKAQPPQGT